MSQGMATNIQAKAQQKVQALLDELTANGNETGLQVAAYLQGKLVIDAWSGLADPEAGRLVTAETRFLTYSCSKGVTATVIHQLVDAGKLEYDALVADYWPEFAANGKANVTVGHVLRHEAGIPHLPWRITVEQLCDWNRMVRMVERLKPLWAPGTRSAYHGFSYGVILGELAQRVDGRPFTLIVQQDICRPLEIDDLSFGLDDEAAAHVATITGSRPPFSYLPPFLLIKRVIPTGVDPGPKWNNPAVRRAVIPAGNMFATARSLARHYAALCGDGIDGIRLLSPERVRIATALQTDAPDPVFFGARLRKGLGYWLGGDPKTAYGSHRDVFGHTGAGGSIGFADPTNQLATAILKNQTTWRGEKDTDCRVAHTIRETLGISD